MPSNIFATTGTNVSIIFIDKTNKTGKAVLVDASSLGAKIKDGKNQKTLLSEEDDQKIIDTVNGLKDVAGLSVVKSFEEIKTGKYSFNPGSYFEVIINHIDMSTEEFNDKMNDCKTKIEAMFAESEELSKIIISDLGGLLYE
jgi:type I restriction enzyme M protein